MTTTADERYGYQPTAAVDEDQPTGECPTCGVPLWQGEERCDLCDERRLLRISRGKRP